MENNLVELNDVSLFTPRGRPLLSGVKFSIPKGKITIIRAGNGVGKTQLMSNILGLKGGLVGHVNYFVDVKDFSYLPQIENISLTMPLSLGEIAEELTEYFPEHLKTRSWNLSSGGEKKRCLLARSLNVDKSLYVLDEPLNHLDKKTQLIVSKEIMNMCEKRGKTFLVTGHIDTSFSRELLNIVELDQWKC